MNQELRYINADLTVRASDDEESSTLSGRAVPFNELSEDLGGFKERISPGAFDLNQTIKFFWSHDSSRVLGSTKSDTLKLDERSDGIHFELNLPDTTTGRDALTSIQRGDIDGISFGFKVHEDRIDHIDGEVIRTVLRGDLIEISPVAFPAYSQTELSAELRSRIEALRSAETEDDISPDLSLMEMELDLLAIE